jgi:hypothetical protein
MKLNENFKFLLSVLVSSFMGYLSKLSVSRLQSGMVDWLIKEGLERMWKEAVVD